MSGSESEEEVDQLEAFRNANVKPGMFVSGWEDPNDEVFETPNPHGEFFCILFNEPALNESRPFILQRHHKRRSCGL